MSNRIQGPVNSGPQAPGTSRTTEPRPHKCGRCANPYQMVRDDCPNNNGGGER